MGASFHRLTVLIGLVFFAGACADDANDDAGAGGAMALGGVQGGGGQAMGGVAGEMGGMDAAGGAMSGGIQAGPPIEPGFTADARTEAHPDRTFDLYVPSAPPTAAVVFLHGGKGTKEGQAEKLGLSPFSADVIDDLGVAWVLPKGEDGLGVSTWNNRVMDSGADDVAYLTALSTWIRARLGVQRVLLAGHSNGGMMAHRMWCEAEAAFDRYLSVAGPPSVDYAVEGGVFACMGTRPYWSIVGNADKVLGTTGNLMAPTWEIALGANQADAFVNRTVINSIFAHHDLRAIPGCGAEDGGSLEDSEQKTMWSACDDTFRLWLVKEPDPSRRGRLLGNHPVDALEADGGFAVAELVAEWSR